MAVRIVRGTIIGGGVGGSGGAYLIAVDDKWGRVFRLPARELTRLMLLDTAFRMNPMGFEPFDGVAQPKLEPEEVEAILDAAHTPADVEPEPFRKFPDERGPLPDVDLVERTFRPAFEVTP